MDFKLPANFFALLMCASLNTCFAQREGKLSEAQERLTARKRFVSNVEVLFGSGMVFFRGDEFYRETGVFKTGFSAYVGFVHRFNSQLQLNSIIGFQTKGHRSVFNSVNDGYPPPGILKHKSDVTTNYATGILFAKYSFPRNEKLFIGFGPYFSHLLREKIVSKLYLNGSLFTMSGTILNTGLNYKTYDIGLAMTTGINIRSKRKPRMSVQIIYEKGMIDINQPMISQIRNNAISILVGITVK